MSTTIHKAPPGPYTKAVLETQVVRYGREMDTRTVRGRTGARNAHGQMQGQRQMDTRRDADKRFRKGKPGGHAGPDGPLGHLQGIGL